MRIKKIAIGGAAAAALGITAMLGSGAAFAASPSPVAPAATSSSVQQGQRSATDTGASEVSGAEAPETAGTESGTSDGPGGHEDPAGNVDHQFDGQE
ncbi:hypothetical protein [Intrasporangium calvum]|uniref:VacJ family lipoprotein n=1 Tax=Intrasporangium calvum (strain ATCC 23552 / DSM 43043 / JCM 3097 / NBRC 12989 / NCIMB 10167 / NRRL B-3866 / 7 KIP) TaxID=710696 RepID=E6SBH4_INTC7|nr:hypothetical protein [Intrasporangium calvum]ADU49502.1 VacJ family lipoprotein [Intrasporangium calvum DSM 43043]AXG14428.1 hypothetical protein DN585_14340 [Intrasporangium calvum]